MTLFDNLNFYRMHNYWPFNYCDIEINICLSKCQRTNLIKLHSGVTGLNGCIDECLLEVVIYIKTLDDFEKNRIIIAFKNVQMHQYFIFLYIQIFYQNNAFQFPYRIYYSIH